MSDHTDEVLNRYLGQQPRMREAFLTDPVQHSQVEGLRQTLAMMERALADEGIPDETARRVINRIVWGEPEGYVDVHARAEKLQKEMLDIYVASMGLVRPDEEPTARITLDNSTATYTPTDPPRPYYPDEEQT